ncbi:MAG: hypothetical protein ABJZ55_01960 [Fuerstiella sp.]
MTNQTPGSWKAIRADIHGGDDDPDCDRWAVVAVRGEREYFVAAIENGAPGDTIETEGANARLIAALPEMLELLREVALPAYSDSDHASLLETLRVRAESIVDQLNISD